VKRFSDLVWDVITSLKLTIACLLTLMVLVVACTIAQVYLGTWGAVEIFMYRWLVWLHLPGTDWSIPVLPGGALVFAVLLANLIAAQVRRLEWSWKKSGIWIAHLGLVLLITGGFVTSRAQRETQLAIEEGQTVNFVESPREMELALIDRTDPAYDDVYSIPALSLAGRDAVAIPGTPVVLRVRGYFRNCDLSPRQEGEGPSLATQGVGVTTTVVPQPPVSRDEEINRSAAFVEPLVAGQSMGTWLVSNGLGKDQAFSAGGRTYSILMRNLREYLPYAVTLKRFRHDVYQGTDIPLNFSSLVRIDNPSRGESRDVLIYMNQPLRYEGKTFYQASFGKNDTLSVLQVVQNPGWLMPYIACVLVVLGLLVQFGISFRRAMLAQVARDSAAEEAAKAAAPRKVWR